MIDYCTIRLNPALPVTNKNLNLVTVKLFAFMQVHDYLIPFAGYSNCRSLSLSIKFHILQNFILRQHHSLQVLVA